MSGETAEQLSGTRRSLSLGSLYLDPNNYRFVGQREYRPIPPERIFDADVQRRTTAFVLGRNQQNVRDLIDSIKANGWLDIDPISPSARGRGCISWWKGTGRVATLKHLKRRHDEDAIDLGKLDSATFSRLPVFSTRMRTSATGW